MKNFLILLVLLGLALPSFANEIKNERQIKDEVLLRAIVNSDTGRLSKPGRNISLMILNGQ